MGKSFFSLGLMSGTSMDGVDASVIQSDGEKKYKIILDKYYKYPNAIYKNLTKIRNKIKSSKDLKKFSKELKFLEKRITLFHANKANEIIRKNNINIKFIGFHGQTIFHNAKEKISKQLGDGKFLSKLTKKIVVYNFRKNDLKNGGQGAPLTPIFHKLIVNKKRIPLPVIILNIGGIANLTSINKKNKMFSFDIGPGNCLIDECVRSNFNNKKYDKDGKIAKSGKVDLILLKKLMKAFYKIKIKNKLSFDIKDFNLPINKYFSKEDKVATLTEFTGKVIAQEIKDHLKLTTKFHGNQNLYKILTCGGGRKNKTLMKIIDKEFSNNKNILADKVKPIDAYKINGDFVESQAFAYLSIRSFLKLPISFPQTTGVKKSCSGGEILNA